MKHRIVFIIILLLLVGCAKPAQDPAAIEKARIEQLYKDIDQAISDKKYENAKSLVDEVTDKTKQHAFYKRIIEGDASIANAGAYLAKIQSPGFMDDPVLKNNLILTLDDILDTYYSYATLFTQDQRSYIAVLAATSYDILRENNSSHDAIHSFMSTFVREMNTKTNYTGFDFSNDSISETDAIRIMNDAFDKGDFTDFEQVGERVDVSFYGIGGPVGSVEFKRMDIQPTQIVLTFEFTRYNYDGSVYALTTFDLTVRYNPASMFGLTIISFLLKS